VIFKNGAGKVNDEPQSFTNWGYLRGAKLQKWGGGKASKGIGKKLVNMLKEEGVRGKRLFNKRFVVKCFGKTYPFKRVWRRTAMGFDRN